MTDEMTSKEKSLANLRPFVKGDPRINRKGVLENNDGI